MKRGWKLFVYLCAYAVSQSGDWLFMFIIPWVVMSRVTSEKDSATMLAVLGLMSGLAALLGSTMAPVAMNRAAKTHLLILLNLGLASVSTAIAVAYALDAPLLILLALVVFKSGFVGVCSPVDGAFFADLFPENSIREGLNRRRVSLTHYTRVPIYVLGGYLLASLGPSLLLFWDALSFILVAAVFYFCVTHHRPAESKRSMLALWSSGLKYLNENRSWGSLLLVWMLINFIGSINFGLTPVLASKEKHWDEVALGWILASGGFGGIIGTIPAYSRWMANRGIVFGVILFCFSSFLLPFAKTVLQAIVVYFFIVLINSPIFVRISNQLQGVNSNERDAVLSIQSIVTYTVTPICRLLAVYIGYELSGLNTSSMMSICAITTASLFLWVCYYDGGGLSKLYHS